MGWIKLQSMSSATGGSLSDVNMLGSVMLPYFIETFDQTCFAYIREMTTLNLWIAIIIDEIKDGCSFWL